MVQTQWLSNRIAMKGGMSMAVLQIRIPNELKKEADELFQSLGLDTTTAVRMFLRQSLAFGGIPFKVRKKAKIDRILEECEDPANLSGPYHSAEEAVAAMLKEGEK
jgi:DNA-damage-inducible protein J